MARKTRHPGWWTLPLVLSLAPDLPLWARPYYAAKKGLSCAACHINPAGGGPRRPTLESRGRINDALALGGDFRMLGIKGDVEHGDFKRLGFRILQTYLYLIASPSEKLTFVYSTNPTEDPAKVLAYGLWNWDAYLPVYIRAGRFHIPYGLQVDDLDQTLRMKHSPYKFSPEDVGFGMRSTQADIGIEFGLNPKKHYFLNISATNGVQGAASNNTKAAKAWTGRAGWISRFAALGVSGFRNHPLPVGNLHERYGAFGWIGFPPLVIFGEYGRGTDTPNDPAVPRVHMEAAYWELNVDLWKDLLLGKAKYDFVDRDFSKTGDILKRYALGLEWFPLPGSSLEVLYRIQKETPDIRNNEGLIAGHIWF